MVTPKLDYVYGNRSAEWKHPKRDGFVLVRVDTYGDGEIVVRSYKYDQRPAPTIQAQFTEFNEACIFAQTWIDTGAVSA